MRKMREEGEVRVGKRIKEEKWKKGGEGEAGWADSRVVIGGARQPRPKERLIGLSEGLLGLLEGP